MGIISTIFLFLFFFFHTVKLLSEVLFNLALASMILNILSICVSLRISVMRQSFRVVGTERLSLAESMFVQNVDDISSVLDNMA